MVDQRPLEERLTDNQIRILIGDLEATKESARSIAQNWHLAALRELQRRRRGDDQRLGLRDFLGNPIESKGL